MQTNRAPQLASLYVGAGLISWLAGDLHPDVTEAMLYELFNPVGPVASIRICRDKTTRKSLGYGYVNFHNVKDAETALDSLSYASIHGRSCRLMWSQRDAGQRKANNSNVYVANLDKNIDNKALHDTFSVFGEIRSCKVAADLLGNSFGYGFVHFETEEAAKDAIERLNNVEVGGQKIQVCMCENRKEGAPNSAEDFTNLYVKCFPSSWDEEAVRCEFSKFGRLTGIAVRTDAQGRRSAFVNFELHDDARRCVQEMHMKDMRGPEEQDTPEEVGSDGHPLSRLYVQRAQPKSERERILKKQFAEDAALKNPSKISLYVKGLHEDITDEDLRKLFEPFGHVLSASAPSDANGKCRGFGFVNFGSLEEATKAVSQMHLRVVHGRPIHVDLAESKKDRQARQQRSQRFGPGRGMPGARFPGGFGMPRPGVMFAPPIGPQMMPRAGYAGCGGGCGGCCGGGCYSSNFGIHAAAHAEAASWREPWKLYAEIARMNGVHAGKITGMMLEMDNSDILAFLESPERLQSKVSEALDMLRFGTMFRQPGYSTEASEQPGSSRELVEATIRGYLTKTVTSTPRRSPGQWFSCSLSAGYFLFWYSLRHSAGTVQISTFLAHFAKVVILDTVNVTPCKAAKHFERTDRNTEADIDTIQRDRLARQPSSPFDGASQDDFWLESAIQTRWPTNFTLRFPHWSLRNLTAAPCLAYLLPMQDLWEETTVKHRAKGDQLGGADDAERLTGTGHRARRKDLPDNFFETASYLRTVDLLEIIAVEDIVGGLVQRLRPWAIIVDYPGIFYSVANENLNYRNKLDKLQRLCDVDHFMRSFTTTLDFSANNTTRIPSVPTCFRGPNPDVYRNHVFEEIGKSFAGTSRATVRRWPLGNETLDPFRVDAPSQLHSDISQALQYNDKPHTVEVEHLDGVRRSVARLHVNLSAQANRTVASHPQEALLLIKSNIYFFFVHAIVVYVDDFLRVFRTDYGINEVDKAFSWGTFSHFELFNGKVLQFFVGLEVLKQQLTAMCLLPEPKMDFESQAVFVLSELYDVMGDHLALQFGPQKEWWVEPLQKHRQNLLPLISKDPEYNIRLTQEGLQVHKAEKYTWFEKLLANSDATFVQEREALHSLHAQRSQRCVDSVQLSCDKTADSTVVGCNEFASGRTAIACRVKIKAARELSVVQNRQLMAHEVAQAAGNLGEGARPEQESAEQAEGGLAIALLSSGNQNVRDCGRQVDDGLQVDALQLLREGLRGNPPPLLVPFSPARWKIAKNQPLAPMSELSDMQNQAPGHMEASLQKGSSDLRFLLTHHKVSDEVQAKLFEAKIDTVPRFAAFVSDATDLREVLKSDLEIDPASSLALRAQAASLVVAWETAKVRVKSQAEAEATNEVREWAKPIPQTDYIAMRHAFATQFGELEDKHIPAKEYIEKKLHELETGEFRAEPLTEVISRDEVDPDVLLPTWNASGTLSIKRGGSRTTAPSGPEQLRLRLTVLQNALLMIKLKHPGRPELTDVTFAVFERYKDYLLGDYCYGLRSSEESGALVPPWTLVISYVISYEHAIRKHAYRLMASDGRPFGEALAKAYKDATVKERHFTTPLALHAKRPSSAVPPPPLNPYQRDPRRSWDMATCVKNIAATWDTDATVECVDILRGAKMDLSRSKVREAYLARIKAGDFDAVLLSPPCSSFSRATFANHRGPRPVRCYQSPRGMDTLTSRERDRAILGNIFADFAWEVATLVADGAASFLAFEQPEDLGTIAKGPRAGQRPASMWQWPQLRQLLDKGLRTVAFHQATFGTPYAKPTRLLLRTQASLPEGVLEGPPSFDADGYYEGPLPSGKPFGGMLQRRATGAFKTTGSERWPPRLCQWLAATLVHTCLASATTALEGDQTEPQLPRDSTDAGPGYQVNQPEGSRLQGGFGPPRVCQQLGATKDFHDGGGLCSPGRWPASARNLASGSSWDWLREKSLQLILDKLGTQDTKELEREAFRVAAGGEQGCRLAKDEDLHRQLRQLWQEWLEAQDLGEPDLLHKAEGQPLYLRLMRALLEAADDPDREFLRRAEEGLPLGILEPLARNPHVFEEQLKWPLENAPWEASLAWVPNYASVEEHLAFAREKFEEDVEEGLMAKMTLQEFKERYGENRAIASLAVIVEDELKDKKRIIHDATHGVRVNHRIKCRDKIRAPGAREKKQLLREMIEEDTVAFSVVGDIAKAHRRYKHQASEHGFMGCQLSTEETVPGDPESHARTALSSRHATLRR
ncbi:Polyadenylate-binding protein, cytoplasmic and nuclear [Symbiodinium microadriaticum]|uniref:Polyadenylate-binding protein, cytoplasmic and nuclear n=1 Tax=Symbiodinium microadriaticum TaxID=2951 RepID=A0A1Q9C7H4_SYMMI|nr:Polyadenylate-binding protein, cytoplasmic and nuclear [Symbiodinium microadriaticum]